MKKIVVFDDNGKKIEEISLNEAIFGIEPNEQLVLMALRRQLSNKRQSIAHTKLKSEVRGGGRKPHKQKGTGRARQGSIRSPQFKGGGVTFGPRSNRNFKIAMNKKQRRKALFSALSQKQSGECIFALKEYGKKEIKTKDFLDLYTKLPKNKSLLIVTDGPNEILEKSARNLQNVKTIRAEYLNIYDSLKFDKICFLKKSLEVLENTFLKK